MNKSTITKAFALLFSSMSFLACAEQNAKINMNDKEEVNMDHTLNLNVGNSCNIKFGNVQFTRSMNGAEKLISFDEKNNLRFEANEKMDFFCDPDNKITNNTAPILLTEIDNTQPFLFTAKVKPEFTKSGMYNAAVLYIYVNDGFWQKLCFEQDERGKHRIVSVRTIRTSDDNNHDIIEQEYVYLRIYSNTKTVAFYYSLDNIDWQMVKLYENIYPQKIFLGISNQCPIDTGSCSYFEELSLSSDNIKDIRLGK